MTTIKATCPRCGEVPLTPEDIILELESPTLGWYIFECPRCTMSVTKPADERAIRLLRSGGVQVRTVKQQVRLCERFAGPAISYDDLLDFHIRLETSSRLAALLEEAS